MARSDWVLHSFARLLPKEFRERVFEPAWADIRLEERQAAAPRRTMWGARLVLVAECMRLAVPQLVWRRGRPTRLAAAMFVLIAVVSLLVLRRNYVAWTPPQ
jgi:hypothetical protein